MAARAGMSPRFLGAVERGNTNVSLARLGELADALGLELAQLLSGTSGLGPLAEHSWDDERAEQVADLVTTSRLCGARYLGHLTRGLREVWSDLAARSSVVALLGVRGAGKSTVGKLLAEELGVRFVELDALVESQAGLPLAEIFSLHGEAYYHRTTCAVLEPIIPGGEPMVMATGGSVVQDGGAWSLLADRTLTIWLQASAREHWRRVLDQGDTRPMRDNPGSFGQLEALLHTRAPNYARADLTVTTSGRAPAEVAGEIAKAVRAAVAYCREP
jgi:XRE family aerobic/anaerobic benzoate catabolism transcriptional regulator